MRFAAEQEDRLKVEAEMSAKHAAAEKKAKAKVQPPQACPCRRHHIGHDGTPHTKLAHRSPAHGCDALGLPSPTRLATRDVAGTREAGAGSEGGAQGAGHPRLRAAAGPPPQVAQGPTDHFARA
eukprot:scaffold56461_cov60-Phaeocystis_antarctica.AAC.8